VIALDASQAECIVFTYKEGLLSPIAHDLEIRVTRFSLEIDPAAPSVRGRFDARSLQVISPASLSSRDRRTIEGHIVDDVLGAEKYPEIVFTSRSVDGNRIRGELALHGRNREIDVTTHKEGDRLVAEARIHQPDFGIKPFTAMLGTLKIRADVAIRLTVREIW
jgi:polyisoprenoid-binding protein YceI